MNLMLNFRQIEIFRAVMIARTVSGAALMLNTSQPGLSRMLRYMEDRLGVLLFDRSGGRLNPTREAQLLFAETERIYKGVVDLEDYIARLKRGEDTVFRVGASPSLGHSIVPGILKDVVACFPRLLVEFDILSVEQTEDYLVARGGEYTLTVYPLSHPNIACEAIGTAEMVCVVPRHHPLATAGQIGLHDLRGSALISFREDTPHGRVIARMYEHAGIERVVATFVRFAETAFACVRSGFGVAIVDAFTAAQPVAGTVVLRLTPSGTLPVYLNRNRFAEQSRVSAAFEEAARQHATLAP